MKVNGSSMKPVFVPDMLHDVGQTSVRCWSDVGEMLVRYRPDAAPDALTSDLPTYICSEYSQLT